MQPRFGMIEIALDAAQNFVIYQILIAQLLRSLLRKEALIKRGT